MQDLSATIFPDGPISALVPSSQSDGGEPHRNRAMTAPGIDPPLEVVRIPGEIDVHGPPAVSADQHARVTVTDGGDSGLRGGRPLLVRGGWNDMGGGGAPEGYRNA